MTRVNTSGVEEVIEHTESIVVRKPPPTLERWAEIAKLIEPDLGYDEWISVGMILAGWNVDWGLDAWVDWSAIGSKFDANKDHHKIFVGFQNTTGNVKGWTTLGDIIKRLSEDNYLKFKKLEREQQSVKEDIATDSLMYVTQMWEHLGKYHGIELSKKKSSTVISQAEDKGDIYVLDPHTKYWHKYTDLPKL